MIGPGKYDESCTAVREKHKAGGVMLIVFDGDLGTGFSCQLPILDLEKIPAVLRIAADQIDADYKRGII